MKIKPPFCVFIIATALFVNGFTSAIASANYVSITDIRTSTPSRWCETYDTPWRQVNVNVPIEIPNVDAFPVLCVRLMPSVSEDVLSEWQDVSMNKTGYLTANLRKNDYLKANERPASTQVFTSDQAVNILPQNMTTSHTEAVALAIQLAQDLFGLDEDSLMLQQTTILGCVYTHTSKKNDVSMGKQISETGCYRLSFTQLFAGIPMKDGKSCYANYGNGSETILHTPTFSVVVDDTGCTKVRAALFSIEDTVIDDIPMIPFDTARNIFESEIIAGHLRSVDEVRLCYVPYLDKKDKNLIWLCPAWYLEGGYTRSADDEFVPIINDKTGEVMGDGMEHRALIVEAQSGKLIDYHASGKSRRVVLPIKTWDDASR